MRDMAEVVEVVETETGSPFAKKVRCKLGGEIIFDVRDKAPQNELDAEMVRLTAHLEIQHQITVEFHKCSDPNCLD